MNIEPVHMWKSHPAYKDSGVRWQRGQESKAFYFFQTGLTGSTGCVLSFDPVHPVILSKMNKPQINTVGRLITSAHRKGRKGREERKAEQHKSLSIDKIIRPGTRMTRIGRIYTDNPICAYPRHPCNPCSIEYNSDRKISYQWHFSSIKEPEAAQ